MRVRIIELRILAAALTALWIATFGLILVGYRPGGPVDLVVGAAALGPILVAAAAVAWPPVARGDRAFAGMVWLGLAAVLLLVPSIVGIVVQLTGRGPQTLLPSLEAGYPWLLALVTTSLFAGLGIARRRLGETSLRRPRLVLASALALVFVLLAGGAFTTAAVINEVALRDRPAIASRFGPTDPALEPPTCTGPVRAGPTARLALRMDETIDDRPTGQASIDGVRNGADVRWTAFAATRLAVGLYGVGSIGGRAFELRPGGGWTQSPPAEVAGRDLDRQLVAVALSPENRVTAEDRGLSFIEGARARHCRVALDGATLRAAVPEIDLLVGDADIDRWRGDLDFWVFGDGEVGQADARANGPAVGLVDDALLGTVRLRLTATDRGTPFVVRTP